MVNHAFSQPISVDRAPQDHRCEWCSQLAVYQLTAIGGFHHNQAGFFCEECGEQFAHAVTTSLRRSLTAEGLEGLFLPVHSYQKGCSGKQHMSD